MIWRYKSIDKCRTPIGWITVTLVNDYDRIGMATAINSMRFDSLLSTNHKLYNMKIKVRNMTSNAGNNVPNQFVINTPEGKYFQSYQSIIAFKPYHGKTQLDESTWDYSNTTSKYRRQFLNEHIHETRAKIESGEYKLTNLN